ncbi:MAG TPA: hypothetical protein VFF67_03130 [Thermoplasmata archaeon]|nr:hypothetical protein [Thermoplasmata archaeon]
MPRLSPALAPETLDYLTEVVLNELASRADRLYAFDRLLGERTPRHLARIADECRDPFFRRVALLESARHEAISEMRAHEGGLATAFFE